MPEHVYMARDRRRDHSFPVPDALMATALGLPTVCDGCHQAEGADWARARLAEWGGKASPRRDAKRRLATALDRGRRGDAASIPVLIACSEACTNTLWRASAVRLLARFAERPEVETALITALGASEPLVRASASFALSDSVNPTAQRALVAAARDDVRAVRLHAAWGLRTMTEDQTTPEDWPAVSAAVEEWRQSMAHAADFAETHHALGLFHADRGEDALAEESYRTAIRLAPDAVPSRHNLAMLLVARGDSSSAEVELEHAVERNPGFAPSQCALGSLQGSAGRWAEAASSLEECLRLEPTSPGALGDLAHAYVELGREDVARRVLEAAVTFPGAETEALRALVAINLRLGDREGARRWALQASMSDAALAADPRVRDLLAP
jgi:Flp pilus assembly protein TadD